MSVTESIKPVGLGQAMDELYNVLALIDVAQGSCEAGEKTWRTLRIARDSLLAIINKINLADLEMAQQRREGGDHAQH